MDIIIHICDLYKNKTRSLIPKDERKREYSSNSFRSSDLGVMGPARYLCAMLLW